MNNIGTKYNVAFPLAKKSEYNENETVDFIISLENKKLVPGSLALCGQAAIYKDVSAKTAPDQNDVLLIDPDAGYHACFRDFTSEFRDVGLMESFSYYPRYVKMRTQSSADWDSLGVETDNCIEGQCWSETVRKGLNYGKGEGTTDIPDEYMPFVLKPHIAPNKSNAPIPGNQFGTLRIRCRLAPGSEVVYGPNAGTASGYVLKNLQIRYETVDDDQTRPPIALEVYNVIRQVIETNNANLSTFVPGLADSVHMSFNTTSNEASDTANYLQCITLPGKPLLGNSSMETNGPERLYYAINDTDTALVGFTMESRNEVLWNYLRSFDNEPKKYANYLQRLDSKKAFGIGIPFGAPLDFSQQKFAVDIDSEVDEAHSVYMYFRGVLNL